MTPIGIGVLWLGYSVLVYGWSQLRGANVGLFTLMWPGKYNGKPAMDSGSPAGGSSAQAAPVPTHNAITGAGPTITSPAEAQSVLANPKSTKAQKQAASDYLYMSAGAA